MKMADEAILRIAMNLRPIDDDFMRMIFRDNKPLVQYVLRIITGIDDLIVERAETQFDLDIPGYRSLSLDVLAKDSTGRSFNVEVQRADTDACAQRARYHSAAIDTRTLKKKQKFKELLDNYVIFITENDVLKGNQAAYIIERTIVGTQKLFNDGAHIIYVNGAYSGTTTPLEKLIHDFSCRSSKEMLCEPMAYVTHQFKETEEGRTLMCKEIEEYGNVRESKGRQEGRQEGILETIISLVRDGLLSVSEAAKRTSLSDEEIRRLAAQIG